MEKVYSLSPLNFSKDFEVSYKVVFLDQTINDRVFLHVIQSFLKKVFLDKFLSISQSILSIYNSNFYNINYQYYKD